MKKVTLLSLAILPTMSFAQAPTISKGPDFGALLLVLLIGILIFIVCRELLCWYWKVNKMVSNQEEIIRLLKKIAGEENAPVNNSKLGEEKRSIIKELSDSAKFMVTGK